jgi:hypothetical protein
MPGWQGLPRRGGRARGWGWIERLTYEVESSRLAIGTDDVLIGTGDEGTGAYLRVRGPRVIVTTGGPYLSIQVHADVVRSLPQATRFRLSVTDDAGVIAQVTPALASAEDDGAFGWDVVPRRSWALLVGAFAGNLAASRRRRRRSCRSTGRPTTSGRRGSRVKPGRDDRRRALRRSWVIANAPAARPGAVDLWESLKARVDPAPGGPSSRRTSRSRRSGSDGATTTR